MRNLLSLLLVALAAPAVAQTKISIVAFEGPGGPTARNQIVAAICELAECVPQNQVSTGGKPDWKKAKKFKVKYFVDGKVVKKPKKPGILELMVFSKPGKPKWKNTWKMTGDELGILQLGQAQNALSREMELEDEEAKKAKEEAARLKKEEEERKKKEEEDRKKEEAAGQQDPPEKEDKKETKAEKREREKREREEKKQKEEEERKAKEEEERRKKEEDDNKKEEDDENKDDAVPGEVSHHVLGVDLGVEFAGKYFSYTQTEKPNLRSYNAPLTVAPAFRLEFFPLAIFNKGLVAGLGIDGGAAFVVGLKSRLPAPGGGAPVAYPTSLVKVDFGARFRIRPFAGSDAALVPQVGVRIHSFKVGAAEDGSVIDGLPGVSYTAFKIGLGGEIPIGERLAFGATFTAMPLLGYGEIISADWFPKGGGFGFDINAWMTFKIAGPLQLKVAGNFTRYGLSFESEPTDTYIATGAVDVHAGGFVGLRLQF